MHFWTQTQRFRMLMGRLLHRKHWWECLGTIPKVLRIFDQERLQWYGPLAGQERCLEFNNSRRYFTHHTHQSSYC